MPAASQSFVAQLSANPIADLQDMLGNDFMRYAFLTGTSMALLAGLVGYFVVLRRLTFAGEALSHVAFTSALGSVLFGFDPLAGMFVITAGIAAGIASIADVARSHDVALGTVLAWVLGLGALFLSIYTSSPNRGSNGQVGISVLFGSILGIQLGQAEIAAGVAAIGIILLLLMMRPLLFASLDPTIARIRGVPMRLVGVAFLVLVAVTVTEAVQVVGALLVLSLLVMPAATAQRWSVRPTQALCVSAVLGVAFIWLGLVLGYYLPYPVSFFVTTIAFGTYVLTLSIQYGSRQWRRMHQLPGGDAEPATPAS